MKKVLITGMSGLIGGLLRDHLENVGGYELSALNRRPLEGIECLQADIADLEAIRPAFEGKEVVVHLAGVLGVGGWEGLLPTNIIGTYNVFEAARQAGAKRVVFASSGAVVRGYELVPPYDAIAAGRAEDIPESWPLITHDQYRPGSLYSVTKMWGEGLARHYTDEYGLSVLCVRIGSVPEGNRPRREREFAVYLSHRDVATMLHKCIDAPPDLLFDVFFATSNNKWNYRDQDHAREVLGWAPQDSSDVFL